MKHIFLSVLFALLGVMSVGAQGKPLESDETYPLPYPFPVVGGVYEVGDYFNEDGIEGIVISVKDGGRHGLVINMLTPEDYAKQYGTPKWPLVDPNRQYATMLGRFGADDNNDGWKNWLAIKKYAESSGENLETTFPIFYWARTTYGKGWYIPSANEARLIYRIFYGGSYDNPDKELVKKIDQNIKQIERGTKPGRSYAEGILSSTEVGEMLFVGVSHKNSNRRYLYKLTGSELVKPASTPTLPNPGVEGGYSYGIWLVHKF